MTKNSQVHHLTFLFKEWRRERRKKKEEIKAKDEVEKKLNKDEKRVEEKEITENVFSNPFFAE